jgi:hypothetical protein
MVSANDLRRALEAIPDREPQHPAAVARAIDDSVRYLASDAALASLSADTYWPKWDSPWWHMLLLHELGEARRIPPRVASAMVDGMNRLPIHIFPIHPGDTPPGTDPRRDSSCHCALGCLYQVLIACGIDVDVALPWFAPWFARYQMADGGLNCDETAYLVADECPSSMVGTIAALEAMLTGEPSAWSATRRGFVDRAASFVLARRAMLGSPTRHNAEERDREPVWRQLAFPRFYLYDVLRGASVVVRWARVTGAALPLAAIAPVIEHLLAAFPDGEVRIGRRAYDGVATLARTAGGDWVREPASRFALLDATSAVGDHSPPLSRAWAETRRGLCELIDAGRLG